MNVTTIDDAALERLAADPAEPLLPVLNRTRVFWPLLGVLAILPCLIALERRGLDDAGALWALESLSAFDGIPSVTGMASLSSHSPLFVWLSGFVFELSQFVSAMFLPLVVSLVSTIGCLWWGYRLFASVNAPRRGFWMVVLLAMQGGMIVLATSGSPTPLAMFLVLLSLDAWQHHLLQTDAAVSLWLLLCGAALGGCLLAGGPVVLVVLAVIVLQALLRRPPAKSERQRRRELVRGISSAGVALLTGFAVSGWWLMQAATTGGLDFGSSWLSGYDVVVHRVLHGQTRGWSSLTLPEGFDRLTMIIGPILPLSLYGGWQAARRFVPSKPDASQPHEQARNGQHTDQNRDHVDQDGPLRPASLLLLLLAGVAVVYVVLSPERSPVRPAYRTLPETFLIVAAVACAASAVEDILQRRASVLMTLMLTGMVAVLVVAFPRWHSEDVRHYQLQSWPAIVGMVVAAFGIWALRRWSRERETRRKVVLLGLLVAQLALVLSAGVVSVPTQAVDEQQLNRFRRELLKQRPVHTVVFVSEQRPSPRLDYTLRSLFPDARWKHVSRWRALESGESGDPGLAPSPTARILVVVWSRPRQQEISTEMQQWDVGSAATPRFYRGGELRGFLLQPAPSSAAGN